MKTIRTMFVLLMLFTSIGIASAAITPPNMKIMSISGVASGATVTHELGTAYSSSLSIPFTYSSDTDCNDGSCDAIFGGTVILDGNKNIIWNSAWKTLTTSPYTETLSIPFQTAGKYYIVGTVIRQSVTYTNGAWVSNPYSTITSEGIELNVITPTTIVLSPTLPTINVAGTVQMNAQVIDNTGAVMSSKPVTWVSNNVNVATVSTTGLVTGKSIGTAQITVSHGTTTTTLTDSETVRVNAPGVVISPPTGFAAFLAAIWAFLRTIFPFLPANI